MKMQISAFLTVALVASTALCQSISSSAPKKTSYDDGDISGVRITLFKPIYQAEAKAISNGSSYSQNQSLATSAGISVGYAFLPVQALGLTLDASYINVTEGGSSDGIVRLDGNLAYVFTSVFSIKGGANVSTVVGQDASSVNPGLGFQVGMDAQFSKNFGAQIAYMLMTQTVTGYEYETSVKETGPEIGLTATF